MDSNIQSRSDAPHSAVGQILFNYFELIKIPATVTSDNGLELWLSLFKAKTEEELAKIEALSVQEMSEAINAYRQITVTPEFQEAERLRSKARHDEAQALWNTDGVIFLWQENQYYFLISKKPPSEEPDRYVYTQQSIDIYKDVVYNGVGDER